MIKLPISLHLKKILFSLPIFLLGIVLSGFFSGVLALDTGRIGAYPTTYDSTNPLTRSWFIYNLGEGQTKVDSVTVANLTNTALTVKVYAVDATTTKDGSFTLMQSSDSKSGVGSWVKLSQSQVTLQPSERQNIQFTISIPSNAAIGDHAGGIVFEETVPQQTKTSSGTNVNIVTRLGVRIYETVPGAQVAKLSVGNLKQGFNSDDLVSFNFDMTNSGNIFLNPTGYIEIKDVFGNVADRVNLDNLGTVIPGKPVSTAITSHLKKPFLGYYTANLVVKYGSQQEISQSLSFFAYSNYIIVPLVLLILLLLALAAYLKKKPTIVVNQTP